MEIDLSALGKQLKHYREQSGLTQEYVAELLEVSITYISNLERGNKGLRLSTLVTLANVYHVSCDELLKDSLDRKDTIENEVLFNKIESLEASEKALVDHTVEYFLRKK